MDRKKATELAVTTAMIMGRIVVILPVTSMAMMATDTACVTLPVKAAAAWKIDLHND